MGPDATQNLDIATENHGDVRVIRLSGELDIATAPRLISTVCDLAGTGPKRIELDCGDVGFVDSAGVRALIVSRNEAAQRGSHLEVVAASTSMGRVLDMTGLSPLLVA
jgi:anti-anti-sigma factor